MKKEDE
jgi:hypothetical protein